MTGTASINANGNGLDNVMLGNSGRNTLDGGQGRDELRGGEENDFLFGGANDDTLFGDGGVDRLVGSTGADKLTGGAGADTFEFRAPDDSGFKGAAADEILDFSAAQADKIDLSQIDANSLVTGDQAFTFIGNNNAFSGAGRPAPLQRRPARRRPQRRRQRGFPHPGEHAVAGSGRFRPVRTTRAPRYLPL